MTREELENLIDTKLSGQGNQVDLGGVMTPVIKELLSMIDGEWIEVPRASLNGINTRDKFMEVFGLTHPMQVYNLALGNYKGIRVRNGAEVITLPFVSGDYRPVSLEASACFGGAGSSYGIFLDFEVNIRYNTASVTLTEI